MIDADTDTDRHFQNRFLYVPRHIEYNGICLLPASPVFTLLWWPDLDSKVGQSAMMRLSTEWSMLCDIDEDEDEDEDEDGEWIAVEIDQ